MMRLSVIFITGAAILALQLIASRVMTPYFGVSLYIWTSILSVTLLFLALGYWIGGKATHRLGLSGMAKWYHGASAISALWIVMACLVYPHLFHPLALWNLILGSFVSCLLLLSFPLFVLSALNPLLVALARHVAEIEHKPTDSGSGHVFFISTIGSVAGVLIAAFVIIPLTTNYQALLWIAVALAVTSLSAIWFEEHLNKMSRMVIAGIALLGLIAGGVLIINKNTAGFGQISLTQGEEWVTVADVPSAFGTLKIVDWTRRITRDELSSFQLLQIRRGEKTLGDFLVNQTRRLLVQNGVMQNMYDVTGDVPQAATFSTYALRATANSIAPDAHTALILGTGAGAVPREMADSGRDVDVVEIDPATIYAAKEYFGFNPDGIDIFLEDARTYVKSCKGQYDVIVVDLFHSTVGVPEHLVTREFFQDIKQCLTPTGGVAMNFILARDYPKPFYTLLATLTDVFGEAFAFYRSERVGAVNAFVAVRKDGDVKSVLGDPEFLREFGEFVPTLNGDIMPLDMVFEFERSVSQTRQVYTRSSPVLSGHRAMSDNDNIWNTLSTKAQMVYQRAVIEKIDPVLLIN